MYTKTLYAGWADMDFNSHMKNTACLDKAADVRQMFLMENGFPMEEFFRLRIGPALLSAMTSLKKTSDFIDLPSSMKGRV